MPDLKKEYEKFELAGEDTVSENITSGSYMLARKILAQGWLDKKAKEAEKKSAERQEGREEDSLSISRQANELAKRSLYIAGVSMVVAFFAALVALFVD